MNLMARKRIAVLFGGASADHAASLRTAYDVLRAIPSEYEALPIGITRAGRWLYYPGSFDNIPGGEWETDSDCCSCIISPDYTNKGALKIMSGGHSTSLRLDAIFPLLHGKYGEDGRIQGLCKLSGVPIIGNDLAAANLCLDRKLTNLLLKEAGLDVADCLTMDRSRINNPERIIEEVKEKLGFPVYCAPTNCSSSIGSYRADNEEELYEAVKSAFSHHPTIIIEKLIVGRSIECAVLSDNAVTNKLSAAELIRCEESTSPYIAGSYRLQIPADIDEGTLLKVKQTAYNAFKALGCKCYARIDMIITENRLLVRRVRGIPGLCKNSIIAKLADNAGISYEMLIENIITSVI